MIETNGYAIARNAFDQKAIEELRLEAERLAAIVPDRAHGIRDLFSHSPLIAELGRLRAMCKHLPSSQLAPVRAILFDKIPGSNWKVPTHQDLTIAVRERREVEGYGPWSKKVGIPHPSGPNARHQRRATRDSRFASARPHSLRRHPGPARTRPGGLLRMRGRRSAADETPDSPRLLAVHRTKPSTGHSHRVRAPRPLASRFGMARIGVSENH